MLVAVPVSSLELFVFSENTPIPKSNYVLQRPLAAQAEITKDGFIIKSAYIDEEAYGPTFSSAYTDFLTSIRDRYHSLRNRKKPLSSNDQHILDRLHTLLKSP
jgi:hypothetical protein